MTVHRTNERPSAPQETNVYQCLLLRFLASLGAQEKTNCTSMLWSSDSCQNRVSADQYHLTVLRAQESTHRGRVFFWRYPLFKWWQAQVYFSNDSHEICWAPGCVMSLWPRTIKILFSNWPRTQNFSQFYKNTGREDPFLSWSRVGHVLRPIFMLWLVKICQVSTCGKVVQHLESCLLWQLVLKLTEFCVNL